jgi:DNA-binding XRE family transcriptional regulator
MSQNTLWRDLILGYRKKHALTQSGAAERLKVSQQTISRWESGKQEPDQNAQVTLRTELGILSLTMRDAWIQRVNMSAGREYLFEPGWRVLAISPKVASAEIFMEPSLVGKSILEVPFFGALAPVLEGFELFSGLTKLARIQAVFHLPRRSVARTFDLWPVVTGTDEILVHAIAYPAAADRAPGTGEGIEIHHTMSVPLEAGEGSSKRSA